jgi:hypothetical protein
VGLNFKTVSSLLWPYKMKMVSLMKTTEICLVYRGNHLLNALNVSKYLCRSVSLSANDVRLIVVSLLRSLVTTVSGDITPNDRRCYGPK